MKTHLKKFVKFYNVALDNFDSDYILKICDFMLYLISGKELQNFKDIKDLSQYYSKSIKKEKFSNSCIESFKNKILLSQNKFNNYDMPYIKDLMKQIDILKNTADTNKCKFYESIFYPFYKILKTSMMISISNKKIYSLEICVSNIKEEIISNKFKIREMKKRINMFSDVKSKISSKYEKNIRERNINVKENKNLPLDTSINSLKPLLTTLENTYITLLKNLSQKILKPKGLFKKSDPDYLTYKIK